MSCNRCDTTQPMVTVTAKCSDCCSVGYGPHGHDGYVPRDIGIGGGDYIEFTYCPACGTIQDFIPVPNQQVLHALKVDTTEDDDERF
jgi:hypothetical protein